MGPLRKIQTHSSPAASTAVELLTVAPVMPKERAALCIKSIDDVWQPTATSVTIVSCLQPLTLKGVMEGSRADFSARNFIRISRIQVCSKGNLIEELQSAVLRIVALLTGTSTTSLLNSVFLGCTAA